MKPEDNLKIWECESPFLAVSD